MGAAMQLYAGVALLVIAIIVIIVVAALVSNLISSVRRRLGWARAHDDFSTPTATSRPVPSTSPSTNPASRSDDPPTSR